MAKMTNDQLTQLQSLPLDIKIRKTEQRIREWYEHWEGNVYVSFSGGKDSTVLLDIVRRLYPNVPAVFSYTALEFPEVKKFVKTFPNVTILHPKLSFKEILTKYGYPVVSKEVANAVEGARRYVYKIGDTKDKIDNELNFVTNFIKENIVSPPHIIPLKGSSINFRIATLLGILDKDAMLNWDIPPYEHSSYNKKRHQFLLDADFKISDKCCYHMKKSPTNKYMHDTGCKPYIGTLVSESNARRGAWMKHGCNVYNSHPSSAPLSFWTEQDIFQYIIEKDLKFCKIYGDIVYDNIKKEYYCTGYPRTGCVFCAFGCHLEKEPNRFQRLKETHPKLYDYCMNGGEYNESGWWQPNKNGLGMKHVMDFINVKVE